ncbi:hypothetical protein N2152v2_005798 [Parachlorella kessleri]
MEEAKAHQYYQEMRNAGSGAAQFKQGLGFGNARPQAPAPAQPPHAPPGPATAAGGAAGGGGGVAVSSQSQPAHQSGLSPPGQALPARPAPPQQPQQQQAAGEVGVGAGQAGPSPGAAGTARPMGEPQHPQQQQQSRAAQEEERRQKEEEQQRREEKEKREKAAAEAWSAYKSDSGAVYYYNTVTGESSWEKPDGFIGDADKASSNPVPVSSEKVKGTEWLEVVCDDGKKYYYHSKSGETSWQVPPEVEAKLKVKAVAMTQSLQQFYLSRMAEALTDSCALPGRGVVQVQLDPAKAAMLERLKGTGAVLAPEYEALAAEQAEGAPDDVSFTEDELGVAAAGAGGEAAGPAAAHPAAPPAAGPAAAAAPLHLPHAGTARPPPAAFGHRPLAAAVGRTQGPPGAAAAPPRQPQFHPKFGMLPAVPPPLRPKGTGFGPDGFWPREEAVEAFRELLADKAIHAFSRWERELPKLQSDPRFKYVPASERRQVFEDFCKDVAAKRSKAGGSGAHPSGAKGLAAGAAAGDNGQAEVDGSEDQSPEEAFEGLLDEIQEACTAAGVSGVAANGSSGGEAAANGAGEGKDSGGGAGEGRDEPPEGAGLLVRWSDRLSLEELESFWGSDPRWRRCPPEARQRLFGARMERLRQEKQQRREAGYRALLKEHGVGSTSRWSKTKEALGKDPRYKAVPRDQREQLFRAYAAELQAAEEAERRRQEQVNEREREAQRKLEAERRAAEQRQRAAAHTDAVANYKALLTEVVRDCDVSWREMQPKLAKDPQGRATNAALERGEAERLFRDHVQDLQEAANEAYLDLLDAVMLPLLPTSEEQASSGLPLPLLRFKEAVRALDPDPRFHRLPEDLREVRWRRYVDDIVYNRDNPKARQRTQRRQPRREGGAALLGARGPEEAGGGGGAGALHSSRRPREDEGGGGMDKAYAREYLQADRKRAKRE